MTIADKEKGPILVLCGRSPYARMMLEMYRQEFGSESVYVVEEAKSNLQYFFQFLFRRLRQRGVLSALDSLAMRAFQFFLPLPSVIHSKTPDLIVASVNDDAVARIAESLRPRAIILAVCSIIHEKQLLRFRVPVINVHNGINPRYRGSGNINAIAEENYSAVGFTVHYVDAGVDTGDIIGQGYIDLLAEPLSLSGIDTEAFRRGAQMVIRHLRGELKQLRMPVWIDRHYVYPGISNWVRAANNLRRRRHLLKLRNQSETWKQNFAKLSQDPTLTISQKLHWWSDSLTEIRFNTVALQLVAAHPEQVLDIGCGDAALAERLSPVPYFGCDACAPFLPQGGDRLVFAADASTLPIATGRFDAVVSVGLFQHLDDAQRAADEMVRVTKPGGTIVVSTLRQFSKIELAIIILGSLGNSERRRLAAHIWRREHGPHILGGKSVARRYGIAEMASLFGVKRADLSVRMLGGVLGPFLARELVVKVRVPPLRLKKRRITPTPEVES